jgi:acetyltransferase-like isoleucine patch superfamily enzyme
MISESAFIHDKAHVDDTVTIGARTKVWQFSSVIRGTVLGEDCVVASNVTLDGPQAGDRCIFSPGVDISTGFEIGNDVFLGPNVVLCNDFWPVVNKDGFRADLFRRGFVTVRVKDGASIGANAVVLPGVTIGKRAMVAANATARHDVPDDYLLRRDGGMVPIKPEWREKRMIEA